MLKPLNDFEDDYIESDENKQSSLNEKYKPVLLSELEFEYDKIFKYLDNNKSFIINGPKECGKSTIVKLYLKRACYDYTLIDDYTLTSVHLINILETLNQTNIINCFGSKRSIIVFDNFDLFSPKIKNYILTLKLNYILVTNSFLNSKFDYVYINMPSIQYLNHLYNCIYYLEKDDFVIDIPVFKNLNEMYSSLDLILNTNSFHLTSYSNKYEYNDFYSNNLSFNDKVNIINSYTDYSEYLNSYLNGISSLDNCQKATDYISNALMFTNNNDNGYYRILTFIGSGQYIDKKFKYTKQKIIVKKKKDLLIPSNLIV